MRKVIIFLLLIAVICLSACGEKEVAKPENDSAPATIEEAIPTKTVQDAYALIEELRFDEAYELLLALKGDKEAEKLLEYYVLFPSFTIDYPEEEYEDDEFTVRGYFDPPTSDIVIEGENELPYFLINLAPYSLGKDVFAHYDEKGRIKSYGIGDDISVRYEYDESGQLLKSVSKEKSIIYGTSELETTTEYDENGNPTSSYNKYETVLYTFEGGLLTKKQVQDTYHSYYYEYFYENGRLSYVNKNGKLDIKYEYDDEGELFSVENRSNQEESITVTEKSDEEGNVFKIHTSAGGLRIRKYDSRGNLVYFEGPSEGYGNLTYDEAGRLTEAEWSVNYQKQSFQYTYDENGRLKKAVCNRDGREITYTFNEYKAYYLPNAEVRDAVLKALYFGAKSVE